MAKPQLLLLRANQLRIHPENIRQIYREDEIKEMAESIRANKGVLHPILVVPSDKKGVWLVVDGNKRLKAAHLLGKNCPPLKCMPIGMDRAQQLLAFEESALVIHLLQADDEEAARRLLPSPAAGAVLRREAPPEPGDPEGAAAWTFGGSPGQAVPAGRGVHQTDREGRVSVYVDEPIWPFHGMIMCHMAADTLEELHAMADRIGLRREWFQGTSVVPHYDVCKSKRAEAVNAGAIELGAREFLLRFHPRLKRSS